MPKILNYQPANLMRKTLLGNLKSIYIFSQMSAVRTGVRTYMDATLLVLFSFLLVNAKRKQSDPVRVNMSDAKIRRDRRLLNIQHVVQPNF